MLVLLTACSAVKLAYNNLPDLAYWWVDGFVDLNDGQSTQLRADLARLLDWHRANELPKIAELLQQIQRQAPADTTAQNVCRLFDEARSRFDVVGVQAESAAVALAMALSPAQIKHLEARYEKGNAKWRRDWLTGDRAERMEKRLNAAVERAEEFYGTLDDKQRAVLQVAIARSGFDPERSFAERLSRQQNLLRTLRTINGSNGAPRPSVAQAAVLVRATLARSVQSPDPDYRAYAQQAILDNCQTYAQLHNGTSTQQRARAVARLAGYERDARELARTP